MISSSIRRTEESHCGWGRARKATFPILGLRLSSLDAFFRSYSRRRPRTQRCFGPRTVSGTDSHVQLAFSSGMSFDAPQGAFRREENAKDRYWPLPAVAARCGNAHSGAEWQVGHLPYLSALL